MFIKEIGKTAFKKERVKRKEDQKRTLRSAWTGGSVHYSDTDEDDDPSGAKGSFEVQQTLLAAVRFKLTGGAHGGGTHGGDSAHGGGATSQSGASAAAAAAVAGVGGGGGGGGVTIYDAEDDNGSQAHGTPRTEAGRGAGVPSPRMKGMIGLLPTTGCPFSKRIGVPWLGAVSFSN